MGWVTLLTGGCCCGGCCPPSCPLPQTHSVLLNMDSDDDAAGNTEDGSDEPGSPEPVAVEYDPSGGGAALVTEALALVALLGGAAGSGRLWAVSLPVLVCSWARAGAKGPFAEPAR